MMKTTRGVMAAVLFQVREDVGGMDKCMRSAQRDAVGKEETNNSGGRSGQGRHAR